MYYSFNSTMVRLNQLALQKGIEAGTSFNSTMVRLNLGKEGHALLLIDGFNSTMVRLNPAGALRYAIAMRFQFHYG